MTGDLCEKGRALNHTLRTSPVSGAAGHAGMLTTLIGVRRLACTTALFHAVSEDYRNPKKLSTASMITTAPTSQTMFMTTPCSKMYRR